MPGAFSIIAPAPGAVGVRLPVTFSWQPSDDATSYSLVLALQADLSDPVIDAVGIVGTSLSVNAGVLLPGRVYWWSVSATGDDGVTIADPGVASFTTASAGGRRDRSRARCRASG